MTRFTVALSLLLSAVAGTQAVKLGGIPPELARVASRVTMVNPTLRSRETQRKSALDNRIRSLATPKRELEDQNGYNYNYLYDGDYWDIYMNEEEIGFDITNYAVKYTGCRTVQTYSDEMAQSANSQTVLAAKRFATFRLCPQEQCYTGNSYGCNSDYGEYVVALDQFLDAILGFNQQRVVGYCQYCDECASIESFKLFYTEVEMHRQYALQYAETQYQAWYEQYQENMQAQYEAYGQYADADQYDNGDEAAELYWEYISRNNYNNNYANNYVKGNYGNNYYNSNSANGNNNNNANGGGYSSSNSNYYQNQYNGQNAASANSGYWWRSNQNYASNANANGNWADNQQYWDFEQSYQQSNMNNWNNMGSNYGLWYGKKILNGYFDENGDFIQGYGYFDGNGDFLSLEVIGWDATIFGDMPANWDEDWFNDPDAIESCNQDYAGSCYNQYESCMAILNEEYYQEQQQAFQDWQQEQYQNYQAQQQQNYNYNGNYNNNNNNGGNNNNAYAYYQQMMQSYNQYGNAKERATLADFLECTEVEMPEYEVKEGAGYYQAQYAQQYQYNKQQQKYNQNQYQNNMYCDEEDEYCQQMLQKQQQYYQKMQQYEQQKYNNGGQERRFFIGPHCDGNGRDITLSVYQDEFCSIPDDTFLVEDLLGYDPLPEDTDLFPAECIPCSGEYEEQWYENEEIYYENENADAELGNLSPMCSMLYQLSGKCNKHLEAVEYGQYNAAAKYNNAQYGGDQYNGEDAEEQYKQMYQSQAQSENEEMVCAFIESLNSNTYDENGQVYLESSWGQQWSNPSQWSREFAVESRAMSPGAKAGLVLSALAAATMAICACWLHGSLARKNIPWRPRRKQGGDATDLARQNSGILMGRSRSGPANAPLI